MRKNENPIVPRRQPRQARSRATCDWILEAATQIVAEHGIDALTTNAAADRAGVSIGSLYQYFPGKEAILAALVREMRRDMLNDIRTAIRRAGGLSLGDVADELVAASLRHHLRNPILTDALERAEEALPMEAETQALKAEMARLIVGVLHDHGVAGPDIAARDLVAMCHGMVHSALRVGETDFDHLSARLARAVHGYLGIGQKV